MRGIDRCAGGEEQFEYFLLLKVLEKMNGGPEVLAQYSEELKIAGDKMVTEAGEAGSLAVQAGEVNALVQFVTK